MRIARSFQTVAFAFAVFFHLVLAAVHVCAPMSVPSWAPDTCLWIVDLLFVFREVRRVVKCLRAVRTDVLLGF